VVVVVPVEVVGPVGETVDVVVEVLGV